MKTLRTIAFATALSLSLSTAHASDQYTPSRFMFIPFFANAKQCPVLQKICCSHFIGPVLTTVGAAGTLGLLLQKRGIIDLIKLTAKSRRSAEKVFGLALVAGVITWLWHEYKCCHDEELPQPYDFSC